MERAIQLKPVRSTSVEVARWKTTLAFYSDPLKRFMTAHFFCSDEAQNKQRRQRCPIRALQWRWVERVGLMSNDRQF